MACDVRMLRREYLTFFSPREIERFLVAKDIFNQQKSCFRSTQKVILL
jgi:hypothetical protein